MRIPIPAWGPPVLVLALTAAACDDPTVTRTPPPAPPLLTINAILDPDRTIQHVHVEPVSPTDSVRNVMGRLYEDGVLVETDFATAPDPGDPRLTRCAATFGRALGPTAGLCLEFDHWPRAGSAYRIEVSADGFPIARGTTRVPSYFEIVSYSAEGDPPGTDGLDLAWGASDGAHIYLVSLLPDGCGEPCRTGWYTETDQLRLSTVVPDAGLQNNADYWVVSIRALDRPLYEYLTTGAEGDFFTVPPVQNVEGGYGVVGSWTNRNIVRGLIEAVVRRGDWQVTGRPVPTDSFLPRAAIGSRTGGLYVIEGANDRLFRWRPESGEWSQVFDQHVDPRPLASSDGATILQRLTGGGVQVLALDDGASEPRTVATLGQSLASAFVDPEEGLWLLAGWSSPGQPTVILRSVDGGATFDTVATPIADALEAWIDDIAESPDGTLYAPVSMEGPAGTGRPVLRSTDRGLTWEVLSGTIPGFSAHIEAGAGGRLYVGGAGVFVSDDGGQSWARTSFEPVSNLIADPSQPGRLWFSAQRNHLDARPGGVFESVDGGITWRSVGLENAQTLGLVLDATARRLYTVERSRGLLTLEFP